MEGFLVCLLSLCSRIKQLMVVIEMLNITDLDLQTFTRSLLIALVCLLRTP